MSLVVARLVEVPIDVLVYYTGIVVAIVYSIYSTLL